MPKMYVCFVLDFFQPSPQSSLIVEEATRDCYLPLIELFNSGPNAKFTVSLPNSLARLLSVYGKESRVLDGLRMAMKSDKVEMTHTGAYHPIFPLLPKHEVRRQIELDIAFKAEEFGLTTRNGILSPEYCYADDLIPLYRDLGFRWTIIDDSPMLANGIEIGEETIWQVDNVAVLMRSSLWSNRLTPQVGLQPPTGRNFVSQLSQESSQLCHDAYKIITLSGEVFGHHFKYYQETFLREMLFALEDCQGIQLARVSDLLSIKSIRKMAKPPESGKSFKYFPPCSCGTDVTGDFYPHWRSKGNPIHESQWELTNLILDACTGTSFQTDANSRLRDLLDRAFYSTQYFWASFWYWKEDHVHEVYEGIDLQMRALYQCARLKNDSTLLERGQEIYVRLMREVHEERRRRTVSQKGG